MLKYGFWLSKAQILKDLINFPSFSVFFNFSFFYFSSLEASEKKFKIKEEKVWEQRKLLLINSIVSDFNSQTQLKRENHICY